METEYILLEEECQSAEQIQNVINMASEQGGGQIVLPELNLTIDRGLRLYSNITLKGQGDKTILRKAASKTYPLSGYHNYGMMDVPLKFTDGLKPGMTVSIHDDRTGGFAETFAAITWVEDGWVGIDAPLESDYHQDYQPELNTVFPMIYVHNSENVTIKDLLLDGNLGENLVQLGGCRGGCIYFAKSSNITVDNVKQHHFNAEGISFQMCSNVYVRNSEFTSNSSNGMHPGAGSTNVIFENCKGENNNACGFFFCVRANHIDVINCRFSNNNIGISIGERDCFNIIENCKFVDNHNSGIIIRDCNTPIEVHSCLIRNCTFENNGIVDNAPEIQIGKNAHDMIFENNQINLTGSTRPAVAFHPTAENIYLDNTDGLIINSDEKNLIIEKPNFECGYNAKLEPKWFRHLPV